jgi:TAZ zinc finger
MCHSNHFTLVRISQNSTHSWTKSGKILEACTMFANTNDDESSLASRTVDGVDFEGKRSLLLKLHHAVYCSHEGYTLDNLCAKDHLCCASKRLFQHMSSCTDSRCDVPCCKTSRKIWKHYRKCRHAQTCPLCSGVGMSFTPEGIAPRFCKFSSTVSNVAIPMVNSGPSPGLGVDGFSISTSSGFTSTAAVVSPSRRAPREMESTPDSVCESTAPPKTHVPWEDNRPLNPAKQPSAYRQHLIPPTPPTPHSYQNTTNSLPPKLVTPTPYNATLRMARNDSPKAGASFKPPLSPRRPQWALF